MRAAACNMIVYQRTRVLATTPEEVGLLLSCAVDHFSSFLGLCTGTVTCMEFYKSTHLLTGSEDHTVCIWRVHDWALLQVLGGHKAAVTSLR